MHLFWNALLLKVMTYVCHLTGHSRWNGKILRYVCLQTWVVYYLLLSTYICMKGLLPYNYFSEVDWALHQHAWMGQVLATVTGSEFQKIFPKMMFCGNVGMFFYCNMCPMTSIVIFRLNISLSPMLMSTTISQVLSIIWLTSPISKILMNGLHMVDQQMMSGMTSALFMRIIVGMLFVPKLSSSTHFVPQNKVGSSYTISTYCISSSLWYWYVIYDLSIPIIFFFLPFWYLQYKFLSYREVLHMLSELSKLSKLSELIELPEVFSSIKKCLLLRALRLGGHSWSSWS